MATTALTNEDFERTVTSEGIHLVDFWAGWCGPCRQFAPVFETASEDHPDIHFHKVDTENDGGLSQWLEIRSIPTLMAFRDGVLLYNEAGSMPQPALERIIQAIQDVNMDEVRAELAAQNEATQHGEAANGEAPTA